MTMALSRVGTAIMPGNFIFPGKVNGRKVGSGRSDDTREFHFPRKVDGKKVRLP
jgi:hypothetical protein